MVGSMTDRSDRSAVSPFGGKQMSNELLPAGNNVAAARGRVASRKTFELFYVSERIAVIVIIGALFRGFREDEGRITAASPFCGGVSSINQRQSSTVR